jgi:hypothetical protein
VAPKAKVVAPPPPAAPVVSAVVEPVQEPVPLAAPPIAPPAMAAAVSESARPEPPHGKPSVAYTITRLEAFLAVVERSRP